MNKTNYTLNSSKLTIFTFILLNLLANMACNNQRPALELFEECFILPGKPEADFDIVNSKIFDEIVVDQNLNLDANIDLNELVELKGTKDLLMKLDPSLSMQSKVRIFIDYQTEFPYDADYFYIQVIKNHDSFLLYGPFSLNDIVNMRSCQEKLN